EARGVGSGDSVFVERRDVDERGGVANGIVFVLMVHLVDADGVIAGPFAIVEAFAEGESAFVKSGSDGQGRLLFVLGAGIIVVRRDIEQGEGSGYTPGVLAKSAQIKENTGF